MRKFIKGFLFFFLLKIMGRVVSDSNKVGKTIMTCIEGILA